MFCPKSSYCCSKFLEFLVASKLYGCVNVIPSPKYRNTKFLRYSPLILPQNTHYRSPTRHAFLPKISTFPQNEIKIPPLTKPCLSHLHHHHGRSSRQHISATRPRHLLPSPPRPPTAPPVRRRFQPPQERSPHGVRISLRSEGEARK